jgi:hypothetical protein
MRSQQGEPGRRVRDMMLGELALVATLAVLGTAISGNSFGLIGAIAAGLALLLAGTLIVTRVLHPSS